MAQWIALGVVVLGNVIILAAMWGRMTERQAAGEARIKALEDDSQTPGERAALQQSISNQFKAHEELDNVRFDNLQKAMHDKLDAILKAVNNGR